MFNKSLLSTVALFALVGFAAAQEKLPPAAKVAKLEAFPPSIGLKSPFDYSQMLVTAMLASGERVDVTRLAKIEAPAAVKISPTGLVRPTADGEGQLKITFEGQTAAVPVKVQGQKDKYQVSFVRDVMPAMSKLGCNAGTCHGAQSGKNGFKLSLRGYDPLFDHRALTDDLEGRRFNRAAPDVSLMLLKPSGGVPHTGGAVMKPGEPFYELLKTWITEGVPFDAASPRVKSVDIFPKNPGVPLPGMKQQTAVVATFTDGTVRDVTAEAFVESSAAEIATVDKSGLVTTVRRGEVALMVRYEGAYTATTLVVMGDRSGYAWKQVEENSWIDTLVYEKLREVKVLPSDLCSDGEFIRRIYIDLTGLLPAAEEVKKFLDDKRPTKVKRDELVDKLIGSDDFIEHWTNKWADLLQVNRKFLGPNGAAALRKYIRDAVAGNMPYDKFVRSVLTASGSTIDNPAAAYYKVLRTAPDVMENTTQLFLAVRFNCNKCHDHPFERWTQDQYYNLSAYFTQIGRAEDPKYKNQKIGGTDVEGAKPLVEVISDTGGGEITHERTGLVSPPKFPYEHKDMPAAKGTRREQLAHWLASKENPYFAKSYVNRIWSYLLGVGIIEPVDDIRAGNPPTNPKLLDRMTEEFIKSGFNTRELMRVICKSRTYQHSLVTNDWNADDEINYSHALARRMPAEVIYDAIHRATGASALLPGLPPGSRAAQLVDSTDEISIKFLALFGKPVRESACECERSGGMMLGPVLNLINGPVVADALKDANSRINKLAETEKDDAKLIEEIYLAFVARKPSKKELELALEALKDPAVDHAELVAQFNERKEKLAAYEKQFMAKMPAWEQQLKTAPVWTVLTPTELKSAGGAKLEKQADGSILVSGPNPDKDNFTITAISPLKGITAVRLEVLPHDSLPAKGPGRAPNGNFVLHEFQLSSGAADNPTAVPNKRPLQKPQAVFSQEQFEVAKAIDNNPGTGWATAPRFGQPNTAVFEIKAPITDPNGTKLVFSLIQQFGGQHVIGRFRLSVTTMAQPVSLQGQPENILKIVNTNPAQRTPADKATLENFYRAADAELARLQGEVNAIGYIPTKRQLGIQDLAWALINSKEFLFNH